MKDMKYLLQFFAESASAETETTGVDAAAAGQENQDTENRGQNLQEREPSHGKICWRETT